MPKVVAEGRRVINNIKNSASLYLMKTLFTAILATLCIILNEPYLFMPSNVLLLEVCVIGFPSVCLSLQPNNQRVEGKFITHVMSRSLSGAIVMVLCVMSMYLTNVFNPTDFADYYVPMCMMALTFSGLVMLYRVCQPMNAFRLVLFLLMIAISVIALSVPFLAEQLYSGWSELHWDYPKILIVVVVIEAAFPISQSLIKIMQILMPSSTGTKQTILDENGNPIEPEQKKKA
jgi:magnesium-transporting ATPase (P-type)